MAGMRFARRRWASGLFAVLLLGMLSLVGGPVAGHSGDSIDSGYSLAPPPINGVMGPGEWALATKIDLGAITGNQVPAYLLVMNNDTWLWFAYDAVGDVTEDSNDTASFALDTGHDAAVTNGREDQFVLANWLLGGSGHYVYNAVFGGWEVHDTPFDPGLPNHAGLEGAIGFGPSDLSGSSHRIYEFQIPFALLGAGAGDTIGLFGGSWPAPGVIDSSRGYSTWPRYVTGPIPLSEYGDLNLATLPGPVGVTISPSTASQFADPGTAVNYTLTVRNTGTGGVDVFDMTAGSVWPVTFWDASGIMMLPDTDGDTMPDTGNVPSGATVDVVARISLPPTAAGCDDAIVNATSSADTSVSDYSVLRTCIAAASFDPPHSDYGVDTDFPSNGLYDELDVAVRLAVSQTDFYFVVGTLWSGDGVTFIDQTSAGAFFGTGNATAVLVFLADRIVSAGLSGPYLVALDLYDGTYRLIDEDLHTTQFYNVSQFDQPAAVFAPPHADRGVDTDSPPDGRYDILEVDVGLAFGTAGFYYVEAPVFDQFGSFIAFRSDYRFWSNGTQVLTLQYPGLDFYLHGVDGPYAVDLRLYDDFGSFLDADTYTTRPYAYKEFDPPPILFAPPHSDRGVDADIPPDGLYDWLVVSVALEVNEPGAYILQAYMYGPGGFQFLGTAGASANLTAGSSVVNLSFSGPLIQRSGVSGNYEVYMAVYGLDTNVSDFDFYVTGYYDFRQFQPPAGQFGAPHSDFGIDTSDPPDGLYDWLEIDAAVDVTKASRFEVEAYVFDAALDLLAIADGSATLPVGRGYVAIRIDGHDLHDAADGPFFAYLFLYDANDLEIDDDVYFTRAYMGANFQPTDLAAPSSTASVTGYWKNSSPIRVDFAATDPTPSDGVASVTLWSRYSPNNATWFPWTPYETKSVPTPGDAQASGSFLFGLPQGEGYYELYTVASDFSGNAEGAPAQPDVRFGGFLPARLDVSPETAAMVAGSTESLTVRVVTAAGNAVVLEAPMTVSLFTTSPAGEFRATGTPTALTAVTIPAGLSEVAVDYTDIRAGAATLAFVAGGVAQGAVAVTVSPTAASSITLEPQNVALTVAGSVTLTAGVWDTYGNAVPSAPIAWTVQGGIGSVTSGGVVTAGTAVGTGTVTVESGGLVAIVTVTLLPGPLDRIEASPADADVTVGDAVVIHVRALDAYGNGILDVAAAWSVAGPGRLSATTGDMVAVTATGAGTITVTITAGAETATVTLTAEAPARPETGSAVAAIGVGGTVVGLAAGFAIGWVVSRRRGKRGSEDTLPRE